MILSRISEQQNKINMFKVFRTSCIRKVIIVRKNNELGEMAIVTVAEYVSLSLFFFFFFCASLENFVYLFRLNMQMN